MITLTKRFELKTAQWAGGTTTQLAIYPATAEYQKFNFDFRISYATVEIEESTFTFMPGVTRHLMILKGSLEIDHTGRYKKQLNRFDIDTFNGEWPTTAKGKVTDFNLMTRGETRGALKALVIGAGMEKVLHPDDANYIGIYLLNGKAKVKFNGDEAELNEGDFALVKRDVNEDLLLSSDTESEIIIAKVNHF